MHRYDRDVLRLALRFVRTEDEAHDLYQEAFLRMYRTLDRFRHECSFQTWLYRVVTNLCLDHLRRAATRPGRPGAAPEGDDGEDPLERLPEERPGSDPERTLLGREIGGRIETALRRLAPRERLVFEMRHHQGLRSRAIAEALDTSEETVRNSLCRAHRELRVALEDLGPRVVPGIDPAQAGT